MLKRILFFAYGIFSYLIFLGNVFIRDWIYRQLRCSDNVGRSRRLGPLAISLAIDVGIADAVCRAAQCDGAQVVQGMVDEDRTEANRTRDLCSVFQSRFDLVIHTMAAIGRRRLVC